MTNAKRNITNISRHLGLACLLGAAACALLVSTACAGDLPRLVTHQSYVEDVERRGGLDVADPMAVFGFVMGSLPDKVTVYPTENYYYFSFVHDGARYAGNIRLDNVDREKGKVHFAYFEELAEWKEQPSVQHRLLGTEHGVGVDKIDDLVWRVTYKGKAVTFQLNDLRHVVPPASAIGTDETYMGPVHDDSAVRFFLVYNRKLKLFHYVLDETVPATETYAKGLITDRITIGNRTGFAYYKDHRRDRKILIGVFEGNSRVNNYFDGPFDQLPDNFIEGDTLRNAILEIEPSLKGKIDRFGSTPDGADRFLISPYAHYRTEEDLQPFHECATSKKVPSEEYYGCFVLDPFDEEQVAAAPSAKPNKNTVQSATAHKAGKTARATK
ncbi:hypothetical protein RA307_02145 [Xanthobacteraceae bacterium Astr-EGSB]|uniref:hypothetical protein n=1 Tax=Astrobacterium formosum TaxID=3069710 RepID=UPI0027B21AE6|nr:hypothetical protein [Xanthobacteraceae bacterium Astr-EGSB]